MENTAQPDLNQLLHLIEAFISTVQMKDTTTAEALHTLIQKNLERALVTLRVTRKP